MVARTELLARQGRKHCAAPQTGRRPKNKIKILVGGAVGRVEEKGKIDQELSSAR